MAEATNAPTGKKIGTSTIGATAGATAGSQVGFAVADVIVELLAGAGVDLAAVENSLGIVISALLAIAAGLLAGKLIPTNQVREGEPLVIPIPESAIATEQGIWDNTQPVQANAGDTVSSEAPVSDDGNIELEETTVTEVTVEVDDEYTPRHAAQ